MKSGAHGGRFGGLGSTLVCLKMPLAPPLKPHVMGAKFPPASPGHSEGGLAPELAEGLTQAFLLLCGGKWGIVAGAAAVKVRVGKSGKAWQ